MIHEHDHNEKSRHYHKNKHQHTHTQKVGKEKTMLLLDFIVDPSAGAQGITMSVFPVKKIYFETKIIFPNVKNQLYFVHWTWPSHPTFYCSLMMLFWVFVVPGFIVHCQRLFYLLIVHSFHLLQCSVSEKLSLKFFSETDRLYARYKWNIENKNMANVLGATSKYWDINTPSFTVQ